MARACYDGHADWYEDSIAAYSATATPLLLRLVGAGPGSCLDVGCGTGAHLAALVGAGWSVVGVDASADQLRVARRRPGPLGTALVQADAARLPFVDGGLDLVVSGFPTPTWTTSPPLPPRPAASSDQMVDSSTSACIRASPARWPSSHEPTVPELSIPASASQGGTPAVQAPWPAGSPAAWGSTTCRSPTC